MAVRKTGPAKRSATVSARAATGSPAVDAYILRAPPFAQPILERIRAAFAAEASVTETMKWSVPHFEHHGILASMAAFKAHVRFGFWKSTQIEGFAQAFPGGDGTDIGMRRVQSVADLPSAAVMRRLIRSAIALNVAGVPPAWRKTALRDPERALPVPPALAAALRRNAAAKRHFDAFSYSQRKEYTTWIDEAKREETRAQRVTQAVEWLAEGKPRHWRYMRTSTQKT
jgi:uncharacterized protein YdeI (YjbR/CyaY-like superfamily)